MNPPNTKDRPVLETSHITVLIPARNEARTVAEVVRQTSAHKNVSEVIVVDNGSSDDTEKNARLAGAKVLSCSQVGLGRTMKLGMRAAQNRYILRTDADIENWDVNWIEKLMPPVPGCLNRGIYRSPYNQLPISNYVVRPFFALYRRGWAGTPIPTTGTYLFDNTVLNIDELPDNWAIDVAILINFLEKEERTIRHVDIGILSDTIRPVEHYIPMAIQINEFLTKYFLPDIKKKN